MLQYISDNQIAIMTTSIATVLMLVAYGRKLFEFSTWISEKMFSRIENDKTIKIYDIPIGLEFDIYFVSVMNKSKGLDKLSDTDKKVMRLLAEQVDFEKLRQLIIYRRSY